MISFFTGSTTAGNRQLDFQPDNRTGRIMTVRTFQFLTKILRSDPDRIPGQSNTIATITHHYCGKTENELGRLKNVYQLQLSDSTVIVAVGFPTV
jgi:hypothetical protein